MHFADVVTAVGGVSHDFLPLQVGCGVRGGCEIAARISQLAYDGGNGDNIIISLDIKNATLSFL